ncbi:MAG: response regulator [Ignavibacteriales bacterium]
MILLVEDNQDEEELTIMALRKNNIRNEVIVVRDGVEALDYLWGTGKYLNRDMSLMPSLVLLDLNLPRMNGIEVLRHLRTAERTRLIPVVVLTTSSDRKDVSGSYEVGANSYIVKPVDFEQFVEVVKCLGPYWLILNELPVIGERNT